MHEVAVVGDDISGDCVDVVSVVHLEAVAALGLEASIGLVEVRVWEAVTGAPDVIWTGIGRGGSLSWEFGGVDEGTVVARMG